jgi:CBS domain-containing protein
VVDEDDMLLGLITETDVLRYFAGLGPIDDV